MSRERAKVAKKKSTITGNLSPSETAILYPLHEGREGYNKGESEK